MKITTKINLLMTAWLLFILILINIAVYISFMKMTVNMEENILMDKAESILHDLNKGASAPQTEEVLKKYLTDHSLIRVVMPNQEIFVETTNDLHLARLHGEFASKAGSERRMIREAHGEEQVLITRVPIMDGTQVTGTLEISESLLGLETRKDILLSILAICTTVAIGLSLLGGRWLSRIMMLPISNMIKTMEDIERSGVPKKIVIQSATKDELQTMASTFNRMIERLQISIEKQKQFISDASHEMRTPLTVIKSYANLLRRRGVENNEITTEAIDAIYSESNRMQQMTQSFLDLATSENDHQLDRKPLNLISLCQDIQKHLRKVYSREITLHFEPGNAVIVNADELKIKQVIIILLDNAMKYSTDKIDVYVEKGDKVAIIRVKDYGIGIPEGEIANSFERFYRVDKARSRETGGTGLGLSIAKNIMALHNGNILIKSKPGIGTTVELLLPN